MGAKIYCSFYQWCRSMKFWYDPDADPGDAITYGSGPWYIYIILQR
jgi:hypothetical protein